MATHLQALHPYLTFNGNCREAMLAYHACLGGELAFQTVDQLNPQVALPPAIGGLICEARLTHGQFTLLATDLTEHSRIPGNQMAVCLASTDHAYLLQILRALHPDSPDTFTNLIQFQDRYQVHWQLRWVENL